MIQSDFHLHTCFSGDSDAPVEQMIQSAIQKNLKTICFTDHQDYDYVAPKDSPISFDLDVERYIPTLTQLKEKYANKIEILIGIEIGLKENVYERANALVSNYPFDFVIGSSHEAGGFDPFLPQYYQTFGEIGGITTYFESILSNIHQFDRFQVYGHLDYAIRYSPFGTKNYHPSDYFDILDEIMTYLIQHGKGIECNSSGLKYGLHQTHPHIDILKRYRELGGELLTIGSDGHKPEHIAYDFQVLPEMLKKAGFRYYTIFRNQKPEFIKL